MSSFLLSLFLPLAGLIVRWVLLFLEFVDLALPYKFDRLLYRNEFALDAKLVISHLLPLLTDDLFVEGATLFLLPKGDNFLVAGLLCL